MEKGKIEFENGSTTNIQRNYTYNSLEKKLIQENTRLKQEVKSLTLTIQELISNYSCKLEGNIL